MIKINGKQIEFSSDKPLSSTLPSAINIYLSLDQTYELIKELQYALEESIDHKISHSILLTSCHSDIEISVSPIYNYKSE